MGQFAALEPQGELNLVAFLEEVTGLVDLNFQIVVADADGINIDLLQPTAFMRGGFVFFFLLLVTPLAKIHNFADRRPGIRGHFDKVELRFLSPSLSVGERGRPDFLIVLINQEDRRDADLMVVAEVRRNGQGLRKQTE